MVPLPRRRVVRNVMLAGEDWTAKTSECGTALDITATDKDQKDNVLLLQQAAQNMAQRSASDHIDRVLETQK
jgi:hypothetical protein